MLDGGNNQVSRYAYIINTSVLKHPFQTTSLDARLVKQVYGAGMVQMKSVDPVPE